MTSESEKATALVDLKDNQCRFPLWETIEEPHLFCGKERWNKSSYCKIHTENSHVKNPRLV